MPERWSREENDLVRALWADGKTKKEICAELGLTVGQMNGRVTKLNLHSRSRNKPRMLRENSPAALIGRTTFINQVRPAHASPLQSGASSSKLGAIITKGRWAGIPIYSLTLEERATCPRSCKMWLGCYGASMPWARRFEHGDELEARLFLQLESLLTRKHFRTGILVRLHVLGDFYNLRYVEFWRQALRQWPRLRIFGYTAHQVGTPIGSAISRLRQLYRARVLIRHSGALEGYRSIVIPSEDKRPAGAIVCPVETGKTRSCATCALCWTTRRPIAFIQH